MGVAESSPSTATAVGGVPEGVPAADPSPGCEARDGSVTWPEGETAPAPGGDAVVAPVGVLAVEPDGVADPGGAAPTMQMHLVFPPQRLFPFCPKLGKTRFPLTLVWVGCVREAKAG